MLYIYIRIYMYIYVPRHTASGVIKISSNLGKMCLLQRSGTWNKKGKSRSFCLYSRPEDWQTGQPSSRAGSIQLGK